MEENLKIKKENLLNEALENNFAVNSCLYSLIKNGYLDDIIEKIDNIDTYSNVDENVVYSPNKQFLSLLNKLINSMANDFALGSILPLVMKSVIKGANKKYLEEYLLGKHYLGDNKYIDLLSFQISRIAINNFYNNCKHYPNELNKFFVDEDISIKTFDIDNKNDVKKLNDFIKKVCLANYSEKIEKYFLFEDAKSRADEWATYKDNTRTQEELFRSAINDIKNHTINLLENYYEVKGHLKYFMY